MTRPRLMWSNARTLRIVDGPDEVHKMVIARYEIAAGRAREHDKPQTKC